MWWMELQYSSFFPLYAIFLLGWDENIWGRVTAEGFCLRKGRERTHPLKDAVIVTLVPQTLPFSSKILRSNSHSLTASSCPHSRTITAVSSLTLGHHANLSFSFHPAYQSFPCFHCLLCSAPSPASQPAGLRHSACSSLSSLLSSHDHGPDHTIACPTWGLLSVTGHNQSYHRLALQQTWVISLSGILSIS